jgi:hypothetical protein
MVIQGMEVLVFPESCPYTVTGLFYAFKLHEKSRTRSEKAATLVVIPLAASTHESGRNLSTTVNAGIP